MASARERSRPFALVRRNCLCAGFPRSCPERLRTRTNGERCHCCRNAARHDVSRVSTRGGRRRGSRGEVQRRAVVSPRAAACSNASRRPLELPAAVVDADLLDNADIRSASSLELPVRISSSSASSDLTPICRVPALAVVTARVVARGRHATAGLCQTSFVIRTTRVRRSERRASPEVGRRRSSSSGAPGLRRRNDRLPRWR
jgi:hypothetical protein